jgi:hypothetical protein
MFSATWCNMTALSKSLVHKHILISCCRTSRLTCVERVRVMMRRGGTIHQVCKCTVAQESLHCHCAVTYVSEVIAQVEARKCFTDTGPPRPASTEGSGSSAPLPHHTMQPCHLLLSAMTLAIRNRRLAHKPTIQTGSHFCTFLFLRTSARTSPTIRSLKA